MLIWKGWGEGLEERGARVGLRVLCQDVNVGGRGGSKEKSQGECVCEVVSRC